MNILIIGSGGREHALAWKVAQNHAVKKVFVAPGNAGTQLEPKVANLAIDPSNFEELAFFAQDNEVHLTIVGPEQPLVDGIVDFFSDRNLPVFGPSKRAAQLEGSKAFAKDFLARHSIPTAEYQKFTEIEPAIAYLHTKNMPIVVKADGLAAGKGVVVAMTLDEAKRTVNDMLAGNVFGEAGHQIVIEEFLAGEEASFIVIADGKNILPMATSQDHKARDNNDKGPNTGGMGAYSPAPVVTTKIHNRIMEEVIKPTVLGMAAEGNPYTGFLYAGLMIMSDGTPKVIEYNCRFGDPETQPIMMRLKSDLVSLCVAALNKKLDQHSLEWDPRSALGVVLAAGGYPYAYDTGDIIYGLPEKSSGTAKVFHAGTKCVGGKTTTNGGRVLCVVGLGDNVTEAQKKAYQLTSQISWDNIFFRDDIGYRAIDREKLT